MAIKHTAAHPGFDAVAAKIAKEKNVPIERARMILAAGTRRSGPAARKANPRLNKVLG